MKQLRRLFGLVWLSGAVVSAQTPGELIELRREFDPGGIRLVVAATTPVLFDYSSPSLEEIVLRLHAIDPGLLVGSSQAWMPEVAVEIARESDATGVTGTRLSIRLDRFRRYRIRPEGNSLILILLPEESAGDPQTPSAAPAATSESEAPTVAPSEPEAAEPGAAALVALAALAPEPEAPEPETSEALAAKPETAEPAPEPVALEPPAPEPETTAEVPEPAAASPAADQTLADTRELSLSVGSTPSGSEVAPGAVSATRVLGLTHTREANSLTVRIETDGTPTHRVFGLQGPERIVLDLIGMQVDPPQQRLEVGSGGIVRVRLAQHQVSPERVVRVVIDLEGSLPHRLVVGARSIKIIFAVR